MSSARSVVATLVDRGVIPPEYAEDAALELHRELSRRARRLTQTLAILTYYHQFSMKFAEQMAG